MKKKVGHTNSEIILVTGGAGFIGSHFIKYISHKYPNYKIINFDKLTYAGNLNNLTGLGDDQNYTFVKGDIAVNSDVENVFEQFNPSFVVNFAAETHVDKSIVDPNIFLKTNIMGTQNLLNHSKEQDVKKFVQISTDEVYGSVQKDSPSIEDEKISSNNPYSASKAAADQLVRVAHHTFKQRVNIVRSCNNYGANQFPEKLIPTIISNAMNNQKIPIFGSGSNIREWLHVEDHCRAIDLILHDAVPGRIYNVGSGIHYTNLEITKLILKQIDITDDLIEFVEDRKGHDFCYAINSEKIKKELNWEPEFSFASGIKQTINWYVDHQDWLKEIQSGDYLKFNQKVVSEGMMEDFR